MNTLIRCSICFILGAGSAWADVLPDHVVKVTKENNPKCVEYLTYGGEMYCSTVPLEKTAVDPKLFSYEQQNIAFDNRPWRPAWGKKTDEMTTVEYVPLDDDINNWKELITSQFSPGMEQVTPAQMGNAFLTNLSKAGVKFKVTTIEDSPNQLIFEFQIESPANLQQDEILKITKDKKGIYYLHYAIKKADMGDENRKKWIKNIKDSTIKN